MDGPSLERNQVLGGGINSFMQTGLPIQCVGTKSHRCWMLPKLVWVFAEQRWGRKGFALGSWEDEYSGLAYHWPLDGSHSTAVSFSGLPTSTPTTAQNLALPGDSGKLCPVKGSPVRLRMLTSRAALRIIPVPCGEHFVWPGLMGSGCRERVQGQATATLSPACALSWTMGSFHKGRGLSHVSRSQSSAVAKVGQEARASGSETSQEACPSPKRKGRWCPRPAPLPRDSGATGACGRPQGTV